ncbi:MAG: hypothetical protein JEZ04_00405 [Spirochaetales bacterium]|nr:hypothetical protein [Spirochaetales bacterium]
MTVKTRFLIMFTITVYNGDTMFYILILPWIYDKILTLKIGTLFLISATLNDVTKEMFRNPRPDLTRLLEGVKELKTVFKPHSPGFPSGHAADYSSSK